MTAKPGRWHHHHDAVIHPAELLAAGDSERGPLTRVNDWLASHLAVAFGLVWTVWLFAAAPLLVQLFPQAVQSKFFFYSSGWVQLFALPLLVYVGNKVQKSSDAQSDAQHAALTHIALTLDEVLKRLADPGSSHADDTAGQDPRR